jgi:hypothetical protein
MLCVALMVSSVPPGFSAVFPNANVSTLVWDPEFGNTFTLAPTDPLFHTIGNAYIKVRIVKSSFWDSNLVLFFFFFFLL